MSDELFDWDESKIWHVTEEDIRLAAFDIVDQYIEDPTKFFNNPPDELDFDDAFSDLATQMMVTMIKAFEAPPDELMIRAKAQGYVPQSDPGNAEASNPGEEEGPSDE